MPRLEVEPVSSILGFPTIEKWEFAGTSSLFYQCNFSSQILVSAFSLTCYAFCFGNRADVSNLIFLVLFIIFSFFKGISPGRIWWSRKGPNVCVLRGLSHEVSAGISSSALSGVEGSSFMAHCSSSFFSTLSIFLNRVASLVMASPLCKGLGVAFTVA